MPIVPETRAGKIGFYKTHLPVWAEEPAAIGLTAEAVAELQQLVDEAQAAYAAHRAAQQAARAATLRFHEAVRKMHSGSPGTPGTPGNGDCGAALIQIIKSYAQMTGDDGVYARAGLPAPAKPGRPGSAPAPGTPYRFAVNLTEIGEIELRWKCDNPDGTAGTIYQVRRGLDGGPLDRLAVVGEKRLLDATVPPGTKTCLYEVTALRSTGKGEPARHSVQFGSTGRMPVFQMKTRKLVA